MKETKIGGTKKKITNILSMAVLLVLFVAYMFPFVMVVINSLKQKRDIIKSPFSWLFTIKGLSFDNFVKAFTQMDFPRAFGNSLIVTVSATLLVTLFASIDVYKRQLLLLTGMPSAKLRQTQILLFTTFLSLPELL